MPLSVGVVRSQYRAKYGMSEVALDAMMQAKVNCPLEGVRLHPLIGGCPICDASISSMFSETSRHIPLRLDELLARVS